MFLFWFKLKSIVSFSVKIVQGWFKGLKIGFPSYLPSGTVVGWCKMVWEILGWVWCPFVICRIKASNCFKRVFA